MSSSRVLSTPRATAMEGSRRMELRRSCTSSFFSSSIRMATGYRDMLSCSMAFAGRAAASQPLPPRTDDPTHEFGPAFIWGGVEVYVILRLRELFGSVGSGADSADASICLRDCTTSMSIVTHSALADAVARVIAARDAAELTYKTTRKAVEADLGLDDDALKSRKKEVNSIIDAILTAPRQPRRERQRTRAAMSRTRPPQWPRQRRTQQPQQPQPQLHGLQSWRQRLQRGRREGACRPKVSFSQEGRTAELHHNLARKGCVEAACSRQQR